MFEHILSRFFALSWRTDRVGSAPPKRLMAMAKSLVSITLNGRTRDDAVPDNMLLVYFLREVVGLTGTKIGCDGG